MPRTRKTSDQDGLYRRPDSENWWTSYINARGQRIRRSTGTANRREAEILLAKWKLDAHKEKQWGELHEPEISFEDLMLAYLSTYAAKRSARDDRLHTRRWRESLAGLSMNQLTGATLAAHIARRQAEGVGPATINRELALLSAAIGHWNATHDARLPNPTRGRKLREPEGRVRWIPRAEAARLLQAARQEDKAPHLAPLIELALHTGMRRGEMLGLEWRRVDLQAGLIYLEAAHTKAQRRRSVPLNARARAALLTRARFRATYCPNSPWVFCDEAGNRLASIKRSWATACRRAGIHDFHFHDLRHTCAAWLVQAGVPLTEVRDVLGHGTILMTERYAHLAPENLRAALTLLEDDASRFGHARRKKEERNVS